MDGRFELCKQPLAVALTVHASNIGTSKFVLDFERVVRYPVSARLDSHYRYMQNLVDTYGVENIKLFITYSLRMQVAI